MASRFLNSDSYLNLSALTVRPSALYELFYDFFCLLGRHCESSLDSVLKSIFNFLLLGERPIPIAEEGLLSTDFSCTEEDLSWNTLRTVRFFFEV